MFNPVYLTCSRHHVYYFRFPIPKALHPQKKASHIKLSLQTRSPQRALTMARYLGTVADSVLQHVAVRHMDYLEIREIISEHFRSALERLKVRIGRDGQLPEYDKRALRNCRDMAVQALQNDDYYIMGTPSGLEQLALQLSFDPESEEYKSLRKEYAKAYRDYCKIALEYDESLECYNFQTDAIFTDLSSTAHPPTKKKTLSSTIDTYMEERIALKSWRPKSVKEYRSQFNLLLEYLGQGASLHISSDTANDVKLMLLKIPKHSRSDPKLKTISLPELMTLESKNCLSVGSINKHLQTYSAFYDWAVRRKNTNENNFKGLLESKKDKGQERNAFTPEQARIIFEELTLNKSGLVKKPYQKWGTLMALYTGARLNEIAQLGVMDIIEKDGIWCFDFNDDGDGKRLKNRSSKRTVPVHSKLIEVGLLAYVSECKKSKQSKIFHDIGYGGDNGAGRNLGRWCNDTFLPKLGIKTKKLVFHSFRHMVTAQLMQAGIEEPIVKAIIGHAQQGVTQTVYAKGYKMSQLQTALETLNLG